MEETIAQLRHYRAEALLKEYVEIRYQKSGEERIVALVNWATRVDRLYGARLSAAPSAQR